MLSYFRLMTAMLALVALSAAQTPAPATNGRAPSPIFRAGARLVLVPVVVRDQRDEPVTDLTAKDFTVLEEGRERKIATFEHIRAIPGPAHPALSSSGEFTNMLELNRRPRSIVILVFDSINTPFLDQAYGRAQLVKYLRSQVDGQQLVSLILLDPRGAHIVHDFTQDTSLLVAALDRSRRALTRNTAEAPKATDQLDSVESATANEAQANETVLDAFTRIDNAATSAAVFNRLELTLNAMQDIAARYGGIPGRKTMIWASAGLPFRYDSYDDPRISDMVKKTIRVLADQNMSVYPIDLRGLVNFDTKANERGKSWFYTPGSDMTFKSNTDYFIHTTMRMFANATGGMALNNSNDIAGAFNKAAKDSRDYYMLGYYLPTENQKGVVWHSLDVQVRRPGVKVRHRAGFYVFTESQEQKLREDRLNLAIHSPLDYTTIPLKAAWIEIKPIQEKWEADFRVDLPGSAAELLDGHSLGLEFAIAATTPDGHIVDSVHQLMKSEIHDRAKFQAEPIRYINRLLLPEGSYQVHFVVRDQTTGKMGSVIAPLKVGTSATSPKH